MTNLGGAIMSPRAAKAANLYLAYDALPTIQHHWELQQLLRGTFNLPGALAELVRDYATRQDMPTSDVAMGRDPEDGWVVGGHISGNDEESLLILALHKNILPGVRWRRHNATVFLGLTGAQLLAGQQDGAHLQQGKIEETYTPLLTSPDYAEQLRQSAPADPDKVRQTIWNAMRHSERELRGYLFTVIEAGRTVLNATEAAYV